MQGKSLENRIRECAKQFEADIVCFGDKERFKDTRVMKILPADTHRYLPGLRVLRGVYRGIERAAHIISIAPTGLK